jgi:hypothetical protein
MGLTMMRILPCLALASILTPVAVSADQIYTNNMSDVAVLMTAYDASSPAKVVSSWCVETGAYEKHELRVAPVQLHANVMHEGCKEPVILNRSLSVANGSAATMYRLTGSKGKYSLTGPFAHEALK